MVAASLIVLPNSPKPAKPLTIYTAIHARAPIWWAPTKKVAPNYAIYIDQRTTLTLSLYFDMQAFRQCLIGKLDGPRHTSKTSMCPGSIREKAS